MSRPAYKSALIKKIARELGFKVYKFKMSKVDPKDLVGMPRLKINPPK